MILLVFLLTLLTVNAGSVSRSWDVGRGGNGSVTNVPSISTAVSPTNRLSTAEASSMISNEPPKSPYSDWSRLVSGYGSQQCYRIPKEMTLCNGIGYDLMVLPNSLEHEDVKEVIAQSEVWVTLVYQECHPELRRFLCSLYAPVCIKGHQEKLIQPCRDLCESVRASCLPVLVDFGLGWPDMVKCSKFPQGPAELCIPPNKQQIGKKMEKTESRCSGCIGSPKYESAIGSFCTSDVVIRARVQSLRTVSSGGNETYVLLLEKRIKIFKMPRVRQPIQSVTFRMQCDCPIIKAATTTGKDAGRWLIMGKLIADGTTVQVQHLSQITRQNINIKRAMQAIRQNSPSLCQVNLAHPSSGKQPNLIRRNTDNTRNQHAIPGGLVDVGVANTERQRRRKQRRQGGGERKKTSWRISPPPHGITSTPEVSQYGLGPRETRNYEPSASYGYQDQPLEPKSSAFG